MLINLIINTLKRLYMTAEGEYLDLREFNGIEQPISAGELFLVHDVLSKAGIRVEVENSLKVRLLDKITSDKTILLDEQIGKLYVQWTFKQLTRYFDGQTVKIPFIQGYGVELRYFNEVFGLGLELNDLNIITDESYQKISTNDHHEVHVKYFSDVYNTLACAVEYNMESLLMSEEDYEGLTDGYKDALNVLLNYLDLGLNVVSNQVYISVKW